MRIKKIEIEGFKSYSQRELVSNLDEEFNAITGLNGSGKSNILDAICFLLGITNLAQVGEKCILSKFPNHRLATLPPPKHVFRILCRG